MWDWVGSKLPHDLCFVDQLANHSSLFPLSVFSAAGCHRSDSVHWDGTEQWGWVREGNHAGEAAKPNTTHQKPLQLHRLTRPCSSCPPDSPLRPLHLPLVKSVTAAPTTPLSSHHGYTLPVEAVIPEAGVLPGQLWVHLGHDAASFHHPAASQPWEQCCAEAANPGPQQALHQGPGWGESKRHGWALRGYHDSLRWVAKGYSYSIGLLISSTWSTSRTSGCDTQVIAAIMVL